MKDTFLTLITMPVRLGVALAVITFFAIPCIIYLILYPNWSFFAESVPNIYQFVRYGHFDEYSD
jgi:hypothetical protein